MNLLLINAILYFGTTVYFYKKLGFTVYTFLWIEFAIIAFLGYYTFQVGIYEDTFGPKNPNELRLLPYLYVFIGYLIAFEPFRKINPNLDTPIPYRKYTNTLINLYIIVMTAYLILKISEAVVSLTFGLADVKEIKDIEGESLFDYSDNFFLHRLNTVRWLFQIPLTPFIFAYCVQCWKQHKQTLKTIILLALCFLPDVFSSLAVGGRAGIFTAFLNVVFFAVLYFRQIPARVKKVGSIAIIGFLAIAAISSLAITLDRWQNAESPFEPILRYFGEPFPNWGFNFYDKVIQFTHGGYLFQEFVIDTEALGIYSMVDSQQYWEGVTGTPVLNFTTYWGGMYIEFGTIGAFLFVILYALIIKRLISPRLTVYNLCFLYFYFRQMAVSFARLTGFTTISATVYSIVAMFLVSFFIKKLYFSDKSSESLQNRELTLVEGESIANTIEKE